MPRAALKALETHLNDAHEATDLHQKKGSRDDTPTPFSFQWQALRRIALAIDALRFTVLCVAVCRTKRLAARNRPKTLDDGKRPTYNHATLKL